MAARVVKLKMSDGSPDYRVAIDVIDKNGKTIVVHLAMPTASAARVIAEELEANVAWAEVQ